MDVKIYSKDNCSYCTKAMQLLDINHLDFTKYNLNEDFTRDELLEKFPTAKTFPVVEIDNEYIGGFDQLNQLIMEQKNVPGQPRSEG